MITDSIITAGRLTLFKETKDGKMELIRKSNLVVKTGLATLLKVISSAKTRPVLTNVKFGNGTSNPTVNQTKLQGSSSETVDIEFVSKDDKTVRGFFVIPYNKFNGKSINELGLFTKDDVLFSRVLIDTIEKDNTMQISGYWDISSEPVETYSITVNVQGTQNAQIKLNGLVRNGNFVTFSGLLPGTYSLEVSADNFVTQTDSITITNSSITKTVNLASTGFEFRVNLSANWGSVSNATMTINNVTYNQSGNSIIAPMLPPGNYSYTINSPNYNPKTLTVSITKDTTVDVSLDRKTFNVTFNVIPKDAYNTIVFDNETKNTISSGSATFGNKLPGNYSYSVNRTGYNKQTGTVVVEDSNRTVTVNLNKTIVNVNFQLSPPGGKLTINDKTIYLSPTADVYGFPYTIGSDVIWKYSKSGYVTKNGTYSSNSETPPNIVVNLPEVDTRIRLYFTFDPKHSVVNRETYVNGNKIADGNYGPAASGLIIEARPGDNVKLIWKYSGYTDYEQNFTVPTNATSYDAGLISLNPVLIYANVSFSGNGHTGGSVPNTIPIEQGGSYVLPSLGNLSKQDHEFIGWQRSDRPGYDVYPAGSTIYDDSTSTKIVYRATWNKTHFRVYYTTVPADYPVNYNTLSYPTKVKAGDNLRLPTERPITLGKVSTKLNVENYSTSAITKHDYNSVIIMPESDIVISSDWNISASQHLRVIPYDGTFIDLIPVNTDMWNAPEFQRTTVNSNYRSSDFNCIEFVNKNFNGRNLILVRDSDTPGSGQNSLANKSVRFTTTSKEEVSSATGLATNYLPSSWWDQAMNDGPGYGYLHKLVVGIRIYGEFCYYKLTITHDEATDKAKFDNILVAPALDYEVYAVYSPNNMAIKLSGVWNSEYKITYEVEPDLTYHYNYPQLGFPVKALEGSTVTLPPLGPMSLGRISERVRVRNMTSYQFTEYNYGDSFIMPKSNVRIEPVMKSVNQHIILTGVTNHSSASAHLTKISSSIDEATYQTIAGTLHPEHNIWSAHNVGTITKNIWSLGGVPSTSNPREHYYGVIDLGSNTKVTKNVIGSSNYKTPSSVITAINNDSRATFVALYATLPNRVGSIYIYISSFRTRAEFVNFVSSYYFPQNVTFYKLVQEPPYWDPINTSRAIPFMSHPTQSELI